MNLHLGQTQVDSYETICKRVRLDYRSPDSYPSVQLALWCEAKLPAGEYRVRWREEDQNFEIHTAGPIGGVFVATWPDPAIVGFPKLWGAQIAALPDAPVPGRVSATALEQTPMPLLAAGDDEVDRGAREP